VESLGWVFGCSLGGELQFERGEVGWERRRRRNRGRECRQMGAYNVFSDGILPSVLLSMMSSVTVPHHCTAISV